MSKRRLAKVALAAFLAVFLVIPSASANSIAINLQPREKVVEGGTLRLPISKVPIQYNPYHFDGDLVDVELMMGLALPRMTFTTAKGELVIDSNYVKSMRLTQTSPQVISIQLNERAVWSDGRKISVDDFLGHWRALKGDAKGFSAIPRAGYDAIKSIRAGNSPGQILVTMSRPYADWRTLFNGLLPTTLTRSAGNFNDSWRARPVLSAGPFIFDGANSSSTQVSWLPNPKWWGAKPKLAGITFKVIAPKDRLTALVAAEVDSISLPQDELALATITADPRLIVNYATSAVKWEQIAINPKSPILSDSLVRRALVAALDRRSIARTNTRPFVPEPVPKLNRFFTTEDSCFKSNAPEFARRDRALASKLLTEAGWTLATNATELDAAGIPKVVGARYFSGSPREGLATGQRLNLTFTYPAEDLQRRNIGLALKRFLGASQIGIDLQLREVPTSEFFAKFVNTKARDFDLAAFSWSASNNPITGALQLFAKDSDQNFAPEVTTKKIDELIKSAARELDAAKRCVIVNEIDAALWKVGFDIPLYMWPAPTATSSTLANFGSFGNSSIDWTIVGFTQIQP